MIFSAAREELSIAQRQAQDIFDKTGAHPRVLSAANLDTFFGELRYAIRLVFEEKEILVFALMQWAVIAIAYMIWVQILDWIPDSVWEHVGKDDNDFEFSLLNAVLTAWSFLVVAAASYPISLLNAAMTAAHYLRSAGQPSTVGRCLALASRNLWKLWIFTTIDAWITVDAILDRIPSKNNKRTALDEALYYAWKIGTIGIVPALVAGKGFTDAAKDSVSLLAAQPAKAIGIRMGYSLICWIVGILTYFGAVLYLMNYGTGIVGKPNEVYNFYVFIAAPIVIAVGVTAVLIRPFYLVTVSKFYTDTVPVDAATTQHTGEGGINALTLSFALLLGALLAFTFFGEQLGMYDFIAWIASLDYARAK